MRRRRSLGDRRAATDDGTSQPAVAAVTVGALSDRSCVRRSRPSLTRRSTRRALTSRRRLGVAPRRRTIADVASGDPESPARRRRDRLRTGGVPRPGPARAASTRRLRHGAEARRHADAGCCRLGTDRVDGVVRADGRGRRARRDGVRRHHADRLPDRLADPRRRGGRAAPEVVIGGGMRGSKLFLPGACCSRSPDAELRRGPRSHSGLTASAASRARMGVRLRAATERTAMTVPDPRAAPRTARHATLPLVAAAGRDLGRDRRAHRRRHRVRRLGARRVAERHRRPGVPHDPAARRLRRRRDPRRAPRAAAAGLVRAREHGHVGRRAAHRRRHDLDAGALLVGRIHAVHPVPARSCSSCSSRCCTCASTRKAFQRYVTAFTQTVAIVTIALVVGLAALLIVPLVLGEYVDFPDLYWRIVVAVAILAAVGTALIPLVNALFAPKKRAPGPASTRRCPPPQPRQPRAAALADLRRRRDAAADPARRLARLERLLHGVPVAGRARRRSRRPHRSRRRRVAAAARSAPLRPARRAGLRGLPAAPPAAAAPAVARRSADAAQPRSSSSAAIAALWPPMPLTAPPRRAPEPHSSTRACSVATPQRAAGESSGSSSSAHGHDSGAVEDVAADHAERLLEVGGRARLDARRAVRRLVHAVGDRLGEHRVERAHRGVEQRRARGIPIRSGDEPMRHLQAEQRERLGARRRAARARGSTGRSASGSRSRPEAGSGCRRPTPCAYAASSCDHGLVDVERAGERGLGRDAVVAQPREPPQQHVDLDLRALGRSASAAAAAARASSRASTAGPTPLSTSRPRSVLGGRPPIVDLAVGADRGHLGVRCAVRRRPRARRARARPLTRPMPPTGTSQSPVPPPITWYRKQRFWRRLSSSADENVPIRPSVSAMPRAMSVSSDARSIAPERPLDEVVPQRRRRRAARAPRRGVGERLGHRREERARERTRGDRRTRAKRSASRGSPVVAGERGGGGRGIRRVDQDAARRVGRIGRVGRVPAPAQLDAQAEVVDDPPGEQAHEVGVARQAGVDARPGPLRHGRAAEVVEALEHDDR